MHPINSDLLILSQMNFPIPSYSSDALESSLANSCLALRDVQESRAVSWAHATAAF